MGPSTPLQLSGSTKGTNQLYETRQELLYRSYYFLLYLRFREAPRIFFPTKGTSQLYDNHDRSLKYFSTNTWKIKKSFNHVQSYNIFGLYYKSNLPLSCPSSSWSFTRRKFPIRFLVKKQNKKPNNRNEERFISAEQKFF